MIQTHELVYFTGRKEKTADFSGQANCLSEAERLTYLHHYQKAARRWWGDEALDEKAATEAEAAEFLKTVQRPKPQVRRETELETMQAFYVKNSNPYKNLRLYCGTKAEGNTLVFPARYIRPTPCAGVLFKPREHVAVSFSVYIPAEYRCTQSERCGDAQAGRVVELRHKTLDIVKLKLFNTGEICAMSGDMWVPDYTDLGRVCFDAWNDFEICVGEDVSVTVNGGLTQHISKTAQGMADSLFFDGGMFPEGTWRVRQICIDNVPIAFEKNDHAESLEALGEVRLPYAIGGFAHRDEPLLLVKRFDAGTFEHAVLHFETLDPCGKIWLNGTLLSDTGHFDTQTICVNDVLRETDNELKILIEPRAPEVYYFWHRHTDCYNGWFCGRVTLSLTQRIYITELRLICNEVQPLVSAQAEVCLNSPMRGTVEVRLAQSYPLQTEEISLLTTKIDGESISLHFGGDFMLWNPDAPVLYTVRVVLYDENGQATDDFAAETGFRTIEQRDGAVYLNGRKEFLRGALLMQFLPPLAAVPVNHNCPTSEQIALQALMLKHMNGNFMRLHLLGYGTNDVRYAEICDRLGLMLVWTTRYIDSIETAVWDKPWPECEAFKKQIAAVVNHPSVIMYEGSNEFHAKDLKTIDRMYDAFCDMADSIDKTRLLSPCSHLYYGGGIYELGCRYYGDNGRHDEAGAACQSGRGWVHERVVRSAHTYCLLCGYGASWERMRIQNWPWQQEMLESRRHSYLVTEFAVTALANPNTPEAVKAPYVESYERPNEIGAIGREFTQAEWRESQAYQALCAFHSVAHMRLLGVDGMTWCCLTSGANNGSYLKPPIDFYGYKKLGFYALKDAFRDVFACNASVDIGLGTEDSVKPVILNTACSGDYNVYVDVVNEKGITVDTKAYNHVSLDETEHCKKLEEFYPSWHAAGYYTIAFKMEQIEEREGDLL